ncbi:MAG: hypothetical protein QM805_16730 [Pseudomonas sp.]
MGDTTQDKAIPAAQERIPDDPLTAMFRWWNMAYLEAGGFSEEAFSRYFTQDAVMRINGHVRGRGIEALAVHFQRIQASTQMVRVELPFHKLQVSEDGSCIFTSHEVSARVDGQLQQELVMGYAEVAGGRLSRVDFVSTDGTPEPF